MDTENAAAVLLCDITTYTEVCLLSCCLETCCLTALFYCHMHVLAMAASVAQAFLYGADMPQYNTSVLGTVAEQSEA
jgi:hypothetical protein